VAGFIVMLVAVSFGVASWQRMTGHRVTVSRDRGPARRATDRGPRRSMVRRLEDRWQRRQQDR
jgi:hypothetical protein